MLVVPPMDSWHPRFRFRYQDLQGAPLDQRDCKATLVFTVPRKSRPSPPPRTSEFGRHTQGRQHPAPPECLCPREL